MREREYIAQYWRTAHARAWGLTALTKWFNMEACPHTVTHGAYGLTSADANREETPMSYRTQFPRELWPTDLQIPSTWRDDSYGNDVCPSFLAADGALKIYVDHVDVERRELGNVPRFTVWAEPIETDEPLLMTDSWLEVQLFVEDYEKAEAAEDDPYTRGDNWRKW